MKHHDPYEKNPKKVWIKDDYAPGPSKKFIKTQMNRKNRRSEARHIRSELNNY